MSECGFCHGQPVLNAASWLDDKPRPAAPCPRCGVTNYLRSMDAEQPSPESVPRVPVEEEQ